MTDAADRLAEAIRDLVNEAVQASVMNSSAAKPQQTAAPAPKPEQIRDEVRRVYAESFANEAAAAPARLNNVEQVQERLGVGHSTVFELIASNKLRSVKVGRRRLVPEQSLRDFIADL
jgi:excisionase family DNA binding protein